MQSKLATWSTEDKERKFDRLLRLVADRDWLSEAALRAYFDTVWHHLLLEKVARRVNDDEVMRLLKLMLTASGKQGVPQGGVISPLFSNVYLTEVHRMLERAKDATRNGKYTYVEYVRFADDLVVLIDAQPRHAWLLGAVSKRLREEFAKLQVEVRKVAQWIWTCSELRLSGIRLPSTPQRKEARVASALHAQAEEADSVIAQAQRGVPAIPVAAGGSGGRPDQSGVTRLGELLRCWTFQRVLQPHQRLDGKEDSTPHGSISESTGLRLEEVE